MIFFSYVLFSPNGHQFVSCKEVSSYMLSLQSAKPPISDGDDNNTPQLDKVTHGSVGFFENHFIF